VTANKQHIRATCNK